jgi:hypothetical protein
VEMMGGSPFPVGSSRLEHGGARRTARWGVEGAVRATGSANVKRVGDPAAPVEESPGLGRGAGDLQPLSVSRCVDTRSEKREMGVRRPGHQVDKKVQNVQNVQKRGEWRSLLSGFLLRAI